MRVLLIALAAMAAVARASECPAELWAQARRLSAPLDTAGYTYAPFDGSAAYMPYLWSASAPLISTSYNFAVLNALVSFERDQANSNVLQGALMMSFMGAALTDQEPYYVPFSLACRRSDQDSDYWILEVVNAFGTRANGVEINSNKHTWVYDSKSDQLQVNLGVWVSSTTVELCSGTSCSAVYVGVSFVAGDESAPCNAQSIPAMSSAGSEYPQTFVQDDGHYWRQTAMDDYAPNPLTPPSLSDPPPPVPQCLYVGKKTHTLYAYEPANVVESQIETFQVGYSLSGLGVDLGWVLQDVNIMERSPSAISPPPTIDQPINGFVPTDYVFVHSPFKVDILSISMIPNLITRNFGNGTVAVGATRRWVVTQTTPTPICAIINGPFNTAVNGPSSGMGNAYSSNDYQASVREIASDGLILKTDDHAAYSQRLDVEVGMYGCSKTTFETRYAPGEAKSKSYALACSTSSNSLVFEPTDDMVLGSTTAKFMDSKLNLATVSAMEVGVGASNLDVLGAEFSAMPIEKSSFGIGLIMGGVAFLLMFVMCVYAITEQDKKKKRLAAV